MARSFFSSSSSSSSLLLALTYQVFRCPRKHARRAKRTDALTRLARLRLVRCCARVRVGSARDRWGVRRGEGAERWETRERILWREQPRASSVFFFQFLSRFSFSLSSHLSLFEPLLVKNNNAPAGPDLTQRSSACAEQQHAGWKRKKQQRQAFDDDVALFFFLSIG